MGNADRRLPPLQQHGLTANTARRNAAEEVIMTGRKLAGALSLVFALAHGGCDGVSGPGAETDLVQFSRDVSFPAFSETLATGATRVEIRVHPGTLVARRIEIERPRDMADREEIESRITAIAAAGGEGSLTLALGGLRVDFDRATRFRDENGNALALEQFVERVEASLASGRLPGVEAKREPAAVPQDPEDPTFFATRLELDNDPQDEIAINITAANLLTNASPPPDAWITVLGITIEIRATQGVTRLRARQLDAGRVEFRARVHSVDLAARTVQLVDGTVVRLVTATTIKDGGDRLLSLEAVDAALHAGLGIEARGKGMVEPTRPRTIVASEVRFRPRA
jgi:hypothetical protein